MFSSSGESACGLWIEGCLLEGKCGALTQVRLTRGEQGNIYSSNNYLGKTSLVQDPIQVLFKVLGEWEQILSRFSGGLQRVPFKSAAEG